MIQNPLARLEETIKNAGLPIDGVGRFSDGSLRLDFPAEATAEQRHQARLIANSFDFRPRKARGLAAIMTDIQALSAADQRKLQAAVMAQFLMDNPRFAERLNIPISGDEVEG